MFKKFASGWQIILSTNGILIKRPVLLLPIFACWLVYAPAILYLRFHFDWTPYEKHNSLLLLVIFLIIFFFSTIISITNLVVLELIQQIEKSQKPSLFKAIGETFYKNLLKALPIIGIWAFLWFVIVVLEALTSNKKNKENEPPEITADNIARELANIQEFSLSALAFDSIRKAFRMLAFLMFPAIAWEDDTTNNAFKKGILVARTHSLEFSIGFVLTSLLNQLIFFPIGIVLGLCKDESFNSHMTPHLWTAVFMYIAFAWSYSVYLEILFTAELYLWDRNWRKVCDQARLTGKPIPQLHEVKRPSLIDNVPDMKKILVKNWNSKL